MSGPERLGQGSRERWMDLGGVALDLGGGLRVVLAGLDRGWLWAAAGLLALGLILVLYRDERRLVPRPTGRALLALRLLAALALVAALFEPIVERSRAGTVRGRVILGVDLSASMATTDPDRPTAAADALRRLLDLPPSVDLAALPRREVARRLLSAAWLDRIASTHDVEAYGFARGLVEGTAETLAATLAEHPPEPPGHALATSWEPVLERALAGSGGENEALSAGVLLLTDGLRNLPEADEPAVGRLAARGVPIHPILIGSTERPRDAAVASIVAPDTIHRGQTARVAVTVKVDGWPAGKEVSVTLERPDGPPMSQTILAQPDGARPVVRFNVPMETIGIQEFAAIVAPPDGDARPDNDRRTVSVLVTEGTARLLAVDGDARWEFQYLRNALVRDPRVEFEAVVVRQPADPAAGGTFYPTALPPRPDPPADPAALAPADPLGAFDAIVVGDVRPGDLDGAAWGRIERYVADRGGTLVLAAGPAGWPALVEAGGALSNLLPVRDPRPVPVDPGAIDPLRPSLPPGVSLAPTIEALEGPWPMFRLADDPAASRAAWSALPAAPWALAGTPKPAATVLAGAAAPGGAHSDGTPEGAPGGAVVAAMPYGLGKVLWVGTDGTWRWRYGVGDVVHHRFWGQVAQWATEGALTAGDDLVRFGAIPSRVVEGEAPAALRARFTEAAGQIGPDLVAAARIVRTDDPGATAALVRLRPSADRPGMFEAAAPALPPGDYRVRLDVPELAGAATGADGDHPPEAPLVVAPRETSELVELAASRADLEPLAAATGGRVWTESEVDDLPDLLARRTVTRTRIVSTRLGDRPELLLVFFGLLTAEWVLRKRAGLP